MYEAELQQKYHAALQRNETRKASAIANEIAHICRKRGNYAESIKWHEQDLNLSKSLEDYENVAQSYKNICEVMVHQEEYKEAEKIAVKLLKLCKDKGDVVNEERCYQTFGHIYITEYVTTLSAGNLLHKCIQKTKRCLELYDESSIRHLGRESSIMKGRAHMNISFAYLFRGSDKKSRHHFNQAEICFKGNSSELEFLYSRTAMYLMGSEGISWEDCFTRGLHLIDESLKILRVKTDIKYIEATTIKTKLLILNKNYKSAYETMMDVYDQRLKNENIILTMKILQRIREEEKTLLQTPENMHKSYEIFGDLIGRVKQNPWERKSFSMLSIEYYKKSLETLKGLDGLSTRSRLVSSLYSSIAQCYGEARVYKKAVKEFRNVYIMEEGRPDDQCKTLSQIFLYLDYSKEDYDEIISCGEKWFQDAKKCQNLKQQIFALQELERFQKERNRAEESVRTRGRLNEILDSAGVAEEDFIAADSSQHSEDDLLAHVEIDRTAKRNISKFKPVDKLGQYNLHKLVRREGSEEAIMKDIQQGHPLDVKDHCGWTPLGDAMELGILTYVQMLVNAGADVNCRQPEEDTPFILATKKGYLDVCEFLLESGADPTMQNKERMSALSYLRRIKIEEAANLEAQKLLDRMIRLIEAKYRALGKKIDNVVASEEVVSQSSPVASTEDSSPRAKLDDQTRGKVFEALRKRRESKFSKSLATEFRADSTLELNDPRNFHPGKRRKTASSGIEESIGSDRTREFAVSSDSEESGDTTLVNSFRDSPIARDLSESDEEEILKQQRFSFGATQRLKKSEERAKRRETLDISSQAPGVASPSESELSHVTRPSQTRLPLRQLSSTQLTASCRQNNYLPDLELSQIQPIRSDPPNPRSSLDQIHPSSISKGHAVEYRAVIESMKRFTKPAGAHPFSEEAQGGFRPLSQQSSRDDIPLDEKDWLVDDLGELKKGKKRRRRKSSSPSTPPTSPPRPPPASPPCPPYASLPSSYGSSAPTSPSSPLIMRSRLAGKKPKKIQSKITDVFPLATEPVIPAIESIRLQEYPAGSPGNAPWAVEPPTQQFQRTRTVKVEVEQKILLIPIKDEMLTVGWLAKEAGERYGRSEGICPLLSLSTGDGALLESTDLLQDVVCGDQVLYAAVLSRSSKPPHLRYRELCEAAALPVFKNIYNTVERAELTHALNLRMPLKPNISSPLIRTLKSWSGLRELRLSGCKLGKDMEQLKLLGSVLPSLSCLSTLDLSNNSLLPSMLEPLNPLPPSLATLNLSFNEFGRQALRCLSLALSSCASLLSLDLSNCSMTNLSLETGRMELAESIKGLKELNVAGNLLGAYGLEVFLKCCPVGLKTLDISATVASSDTGTLRGLVAYTARGKPDLDLETLSLRNFHLGDLNMEDFKTAVFHLGRLKKLDLSSNSVTPSGIRELLDKFNEAESQLVNLLLNNCDRIVEQGWEDLVTSVKSCMDWNTKLELISFPEKNNELTESMRAVWARIWGSSAHVLSDSLGNIVFSVK